MDRSNPLSGLSEQQLLQLAALASQQLIQQQGNYAPSMHPTFGSQMTMPPGSPQPGTYPYGHAVPQLHCNWSSEVGGSTASTEPVRVESPNPNLGPIDVEERSPPAKPDRSSTATRTDRKKGKQPATDQEGKRIKQDNYQALEDRLLAQSYLEISGDPMTNTGQSMLAFWARVANLYNSKRGSYPERSIRSLQTRYEILRKSVAKFSSYYADVIRRNPSGMTDADKVTLACTEFASCEEDHKPFKFLHCWEIMRDNPRFLDTKHGRNFRSTQRAMYQDQLLNPGPDDFAAAQDFPTPTSSAGKRPMGRDAAKKASKKQQAASGSTGGSSFANSMHDLVLTRFAEHDTVRTSSREAFFEWKKEAKEEARQDRKMMLEIEKQKLELSKQKEVLIEIEKERLQLEHQKMSMREKMYSAELLKVEVLKKQEDERILAIKLEELDEPRRSFYAAQQKEILARYGVRPGSPK